MSSFWQFFDNQMAIFRRVKSNVSVYLCVRYVSDLPGEIQKSASFISGQTGSEEQPMLQSSVSMIGPDGQPLDQEEGNILYA